MYIKIVFKKLIKIIIKKRINYIRKITRINSIKRIVLRFMWEILKKL